MHSKLKPFGYDIYGKTIGEAWLSLVESIIKHGIKTSDEGRHRLSLQSVRIRSKTQIFPDFLIKKYGNNQNTTEIINLTLYKTIMYDIDIVPSFTPGSKSYYARIKDWKMLDFVTKRLSKIPESKKAIMSFIRQEDYERVLKKPKDDYLPCITTIHFRLIQKNTKYYMNTIFNARSLDAYQKAHGNLAAIVLISQEVIKRLIKKLKINIVTGFLDGLITDAHIYQENFTDAKNLIKRYRKNIEN